MTILVLKITISTTAETQQKREKAEAARALALQRLRRGSPPSDVDPCRIAWASRAFVWAWACGRGTVVCSRAPLLLPPPRVHLGGYRVGAGGGGLCVLNLVDFFLC